MPYSTQNGLRIYYETHGEGPPVVLVHANPFDRRLWAYQVARFSPFHKVIIMDLRGYGLSSKPDGAFTLADMANDVLGVCADEKVDRAVFVGVSVGSGIAMLIGLDHPGIVDALILVGGSSRGPRNVQGIVEGLETRELRSYLLELMRGYVAPEFADSRLGRWYLDLFVENAEALSARTIAQIFRARGSCDMSGRIRDLGSPTLVINGEFDLSLPAGRETAALLPGAQHVVIPKTGHACCIEDPAAFDDAVIDFLAANGLWNASACRTRS